LQSTSLINSKRQREGEERARETEGGREGRKEGRREGGRAMPK